jgi:hypothetical protein
MSTEAVVALVVGTVVILLVPALILSSDWVERLGNLRSKLRRD